MDLAVRLIEPDEADDWVRSAEAIFGMPSVSDEWLRREHAVHEFDRAFGAFDGDRMVGTTGAYSFAMTVPGGVDVPTAGVTMVTVAPSHRRRGLLTEMMRQQLDEIADRGEPLAVLNASESVIYGRFGYGPAIDTVAFEIDSRLARFDPALDDAGSFEVRTPDEAIDVVADVYERYRPTRSGSIRRSRAWWELVLAPLDSWRGGGDLYVALHRPPTGEADGYVIYKIRGRVEHGLQLGTIEVQELTGVTPDVELALWGFVFDVDLTTRAVLPWRPVDDPVRWRLADPRQLRTTARVDMVWLRLVDVAGALQRRTYATDHRALVEVVDPFLPRNDGTYVVGGDGDAGSTASTPPDVTLDVRTLSAAYLGGVSFATLHAAGQVVEHRPGAVRELDALFVTECAPHCTTRF